MECERLYQLLQPEAPGTAARVFRVAHHAMMTAGIGIMLADTVAPWRGGLGRRIRCRVPDRLRLLLCRIRAAADRCAGGAGRRASRQVALATRLDSLARRL